ncbi:DNA-binding response regulator [Chryseobacterium indologenes]|uniref:response regulator n=1 Tax=Chryseobacterium indologenes TaxID=253 RepID=UPI000BFB85F2|nr:response regulator transcription factor [Chryseobacterium indologenes]ATN05141.1 DNA-binding response regulator [Chryseobacterium indologenes]AYY86106.1 DNA-binding response regulator [Chryseobacterium indologenes]QIX83006.1 response regulator transcription factor [Chryseobacterium indologenes]UDQ52682.1 response regulator transcription factor [Chryseobacterium indologenes]HAO27321.1 DNA-binding response regulator [Chryseobacterium indologenes]
MLQHKIKIALVDDHPMVLEGLIKVLSSVKNIEVAQHFFDGQSLLQFLDHTAVDIVLLDITLPDIDGIVLCKTIKHSFPKTIVLALSHHHSRKIIMDMLNNGANGYMLKNVSLEELVNCIDAALRGEIVFSRDVKEIIASPQLSGDGKSIRLTNREKEVLGLIAAGKTTMQMAEQLFISKFTIESHRKNLLQKFEAKNVAELISLAADKGFL